VSTGLTRFICLHSPLGRQGDNHHVNGDQPLRNGDDTVKVAIDLEDERYGMETLWAEAVGESRHRLRNVPILASGYSEQTW
jgi:hypothetical protein